MKYYKLIININLTTNTYSINISTMTNIRKKQRVTLFLNPELIKQAKAEALVEDLSFTALIEKALIQYLPSETIIKKTHVILGSI